MSKVRCALLLLLATLGAGCSGPGRVAEADPEGPAGEATRPAAAPREPEVEILTATSGVGVETTLEVETRLITETEVVVVGRSSGVLEQVLVERGDEVEAGDVLAVFENEMQALSFAAAAAELARAAAEERRLGIMREQDLVPAQEYDEALRDRDVAKAERDLARHLLERTKVRAPFAGVVTERFAREGMYVLEDDVIPLFRLLGQGPLQARVYLPEWTAGYVSRGQEVEVVPEFGGAPVQGRLHWISPIVDPVAGTLEVRVQVASRRSPRVGSSILLRFHLVSDPDRLSVPRDSLLEGDAESGDRATLMLAASDGGWRKASVRLGIVGAEHAEIRSGLQEGDRFRRIPRADE